MRPRYRGQSDDLPSRTAILSETADSILSETADCRNPHGNRPIENGVLSDCDDLCDNPPYRRHKQGVLDVKARDKLTMNGWSDGGSPGVYGDCVAEGKCEDVDKRQVNSQKAVLLDHGCYACNGWWWNQSHHVLVFLFVVPDLCLLESDLVQLLAQQRLQQLLTSDSGHSLRKPHTASFVTSTPNCRQDVPSHPPAGCLSL